MPLHCPASTDDAAHDVQADFDGLLDHLIARHWSCQTSPQGTVTLRSLMEMQRGAHQEPTEPEGWTLPARQTFVWRLWCRLPADMRKALIERADHLVSRRKANDFDAAAFQIVSQCVFGAAAGILVTNLDKATRAEFWNATDGCEAVAHLANEVGREALAAACEHVFEVAATLDDPYAIRSLAQQRARTAQTTIENGTFEVSGEANTRVVKAHLAVNAKWHRRQIEQDGTLIVTHVGDVLRRVGGRNRYVSDIQRVRLVRKHRNAWSRLENSVAIADDGSVIRLGDAKRLAALKGLVSLRNTVTGIDQAMPGALFRMITITLPALMHPNPSVGADCFDAILGSVYQRIEWFTEEWSGVRKRMSDRSKAIRKQMEAAIAGILAEAKAKGIDAEVSGFRILDGAAGVWVKEAHLDGTLHVHALLFVLPEREADFKWSLLGKRVGHLARGDDEGAFIAHPCPGKDPFTRCRIEWREIPRDKVTNAVAYVCKYAKKGMEVEAVLSNLRDGKLAKALATESETVQDFQLEKHVDLVLREGERPDAKHPVSGGTLWRRANRHRGFGFFGLAPGVRTSLERLCGHKPEEGSNTILDQAARALSEGRHGDAFRLVAPACAAWHRIRVSRQFHQPARVAQTVAIYTALTPALIRSSVEFRAGESRRGRLGYTGTEAWETARALEALDALQAVKRHQMPAHAPAAATARRKRFYALEKGQRASAAEALATWTRHAVQSSKPTGWTLVNAASEVLPDVFEHLARHDEDASAVAGASVFAALLYERDRVSGDPVIHSWRRRIERLLAVLPARVRVRIAQELRDLARMSDAERFEAACAAVKAPAVSYEPVDLPEWLPAWNDKAENQTQVAAEQDEQPEQPAARNVAADLAETVEDERTRAILLAISSTFGDRMNAKAKAEQTAKPPPAWATDDPSTILRRHATGLAALAEGNEDGASHVGAVPGSVPRNHRNDILVQVARHRLAGLRGVTPTSRSRYLHVLACLVDQLPEVQRRFFDVVGTMPDGTKLRLDGLWRHLLRLADECPHADVRHALSVVLGAVEMAARGDRTGVTISNLRLAQPDVTATIQAAFRDEQGRETHPGRPDLEAVLRGWFRAWGHVVDPAKMRTVSPLSALVAEIRIPHAPSAKRAASVVAEARAYARRVHEHAEEAARRNAVPGPRVEPCRLSLAEADTRGQPPPWRSTSLFAAETA